MKNLPFLIFQAQNCRHVFQPYPTLYLTDAQKLVLFSWRQIHHPAPQHANRKFLKEEYTF